MNKKTKKIIIALLLFGVMVLGILQFVNFKQEKNNELTTVNVGYKKHVAYIPFFVAMEKNFFQKRGLKVNPILFESTNEMLSSVVSKNIDAAIGGANLPTVFSIEEKSPNLLKIFAEVNITNDSRMTCVLVKNDSYLSNIKDLKEKNIGVWPGSFSLLWVGATLASNNISLDEVKTISLEPNLQIPALESSQIDAVFAIEPTCSFATNKKIAKIIDNEPMKDFTDLFAVSVISSDFVNKLPKTADDIVDAIDESIEFIKSNPDESIKIMIKYTEYDQDLIAGLKLPAYTKSTDSNHKKIQTLADKLYDNKILENKINIDNMFYR